MEEVKSKKTIGSLLLESGIITVKDAEDIINLQQQENIRFGDAALKLGLVKQSDISFAISKQFDYSYLSIDDESIDRCLISAFLPSGPEIEALRSLRSQLSLRWMADNKALLVCGARSNNGSSYVSANLAVLFSQLGKKTLLIDANMRKPSQHLCFRNPNKQGLSDMLVGRADDSAITPIQGIDNLSVLFSGTAPPNPLELLGHSKFLNLKDRLSGQFDAIIIDVPPLLDYSDAEILASAVKGVLLVARKNHVSIRDLKKSKTKVELSGAIPLGVAVNNF